MEGIRPFVKEDIPQVASLYMTVYHNSKGETPRSLQSCFDNIFFRNPWYDDNLPSLVYEDHGEAVAGFLGVIPRRLSLRAQSIQAAISSQLMVAPAKRGSLAAVRLLKAFLEGPQDLSMADEATDATRKIWEKLGGATSLLYSMRWTRPLRPASYLRSLFLKRKSPVLFELLTQAACNMVDFMSARLPKSPFAPSMPQFRTNELAATSASEFFVNGDGRQSLWPNYEDGSLDWLFDMAAKKKCHGALRKVAVHNSHDELVGWYLYYRKPGAISQVLQLVSKPNAINQVLDHLFYDAWQGGGIALSGRLEPRFLREFSDKYCLINRGYNWMLIHSKKPEIIGAIAQGQAFLTRLEGEWWIPIIGERFE